MSETLEVISFGPFRLDTERRRVDRNGIPVVLSSRAFDILVLLVENRGRVVGKDEIMTRVWRGMIVEENNLAVQISALRRALAEGAGDTPLIVTVPGQGYRFVGRLNQTDDMPRDVLTPPAAQREPPLPVWPGAAIHARRPRWRIAVIAACVAALVLGGVTAALLQPRLAQQPAAPLSPAAAPLSCRSAVPRSVRRPVLRLSRRCHHRRPDHRSLFDPRQHRHRP